jgi:ABC-type nitrate/sulfonate/bicarbonate transport system permease component
VSHGSPAHVEVGGLRKTFQNSDTTLTALADVSLSVAAGESVGVIGAVVAEWFSGQDGLGRVIQGANSNLDMPTAFAAIVSLAALGVGLYVIVSIVERRLLFWHESAINTQGAGR